jgi:cellulose synthase/poly-beta-1,6-N-acetylglucosamine synthase-like glycosyltransferase
MARFYKKVFSLGVIVLASFLILWKLDWLDYGNMILFYGLESILLGMFLYVYVPVFVFFLAKSKLSRWVHVKSTSEMPLIPTMFTILIPAHNESLLLPKLLASIQAQNFPKEYFNVIVIADNCTDNTADLAREGHAICYERKTTQPSDKTQALEYAWKMLQTEKGAIENSTIVLIDADCQLEPDFLAEVHRMKGRPNAAPVMQTFRYVRNAHQSRMTMLDGASEALRQWVILGSRKVLGLQCFICGSGVVLPYSVFSQLMSCDVHSVVEDRVWQGYLLENGIRTEWCPSAKINYEVVETHQDFQKQRKRWIEGQLSLGKRNSARMFLRGIWEGNFSKLDYAASLLQLPRAAMMASALFFTVFSFFVPHYSFVAWWAWGLIGGAFFFYVAIGLMLIDAKWGEYLAIFEAPKIIFGVVRSTFYGIFGKKISNWEATRELSEPVPSNVKEIG